MKSNKYYIDFDKILSFKSADVHMFFINGARGTGKTTNCKQMLVDHYLKTGKRFLWVRRYGTELKGKAGFKEFPGCVKGFWKKPQAVNEKLAAMKLTTRANRAYLDDKDIGGFMALSTSAGAKGSDGLFADVDIIVFDEYLVLPGSSLRYLSRDVTMMLDLINTVFRPGPNNNEGITLFLGNSITFANPYFIYFRVPPLAPNQQYYLDKKRHLLVVQYRNDEYERAVKNTWFGELINNTPYEEYAVNNKYLLDTNDFIVKKSSHAVFTFNVRFDGEQWGIYADESFVYVTYNIEPSQPFYVFTKADHGHDSIMIKSIRGTRFEVLIKNYQMGLVMFDNIVIKTKFVDLIAFFLSK